VETTQSFIPALERDARLSIHAISVLLGMVPAALVSELSSDGPLPTLRDTVPIGLPSDLLRRRPDIRRAERQLAAATARIGMATADLYPRFSLTGSLGLESSQFNTLTDLGSGYWSIGPSMRWPVLDWGRIRSNIQVLSAREEQAFITYESTILTGLREVEDALISFARNQERLQSLRNAVDSNRQAVDLARDLYTQGLTDFLSVLQAQRDLFITEEALANNEIEVATDLVGLYKSLGGGWSIDEQRQAERARTDASPDASTAGQRKLDVTARSPE
jgi:NodT family efflux transporter outer membrane factor (OMF) lipoprotein